jgi:hypothetical protein
LLLSFVVTSVITRSDSNTEMSKSKNELDEPSGPLLENKPVKSSDVWGAGEGFSA